MMDENFGARSLFASVGCCAKIKLEENKKPERNVVVS
jgi:hypothetical protein